MLKIKLVKLNYLIFALARGFDIIDDVELIDGGDKDKVGLKYMKRKKYMTNLKYLCATALNGRSQIFGCIL